MAVPLQPPSSAGEAAAAAAFTDLLCAASGTATRVAIITAPNVAAPNIDTRRDITHSPTKGKSRRLVAEQALAGEHHRDAMLIGGRNDLRVAH